MTENVKQDTVQNMPKCGLSLMRIFSYMDIILSVFSRIWIELEILSKYGKKQTRFCPPTGKTVFWHISSSKRTVVGYQPIRQVCKQFKCNKPGFL